MHYVTHIYIYIYHTHSFLVCGGQDLFSLDLSGCLQVIRLLSSLTRKRHSPTPLPPSAQSIL